jgi:hypothetical protein
MIPNRESMEHIKKSGAEKEEEKHLFKLSET